MFSATHGLPKLAHRSKVEPLIARPEHTGDNAAMIAFAAFVNPSLAKPKPQTIAPALALGKH